MKIKVKRSLLTAPFLTLAAALLITGCTGNGETAGLAKPMVRIRIKQSSKKGAYAMPSLMRRVQSQSNIL